MPLRIFRCNCFYALVLVGVSCPALLRAQDMSAIAILQPASGCNLSSAETIRARFINHGPGLPGGSILDLSYSINGGVPVTETVFLGNPQPPNAKFNYSFVAPADLSVQGSYTIVASIALPADGNPGNNASDPYTVNNWTASIAGSLAGPGEPVVAGVLSLDGQTGAVVEWQQSTDGARWRALENNSATQAFSGLTAPTEFRVLVQNGLCAPVLSSALRVVTNEIYANGFEP